MNGQPNQGLASLTGGMGGSPTLGGAPQTPAMPQGGAQKPQPTPQGGLPPDLLKALAMARVKKLQDAAKRDLEIQMAQQQAASGEDQKTVVQQMEEGVEKEAMDETQQALTKKLSGGLQKVAQQSMQPQGQPMSGGIAAAPGANQAAQPEAMAAGGIVAFKKGGTDGEEDDQPVDAYNRASNETWLGQGIRRGKAAVKDVAGLLSLRPWATDPERVAKGDTRTNAEVEGYTPEGYKVNDRADQLKAAFDRQQAARPVSEGRPAITSFDPMNPWARVGTTPAALNQRPGEFNDTPLVRREDMRGSGIATTPRPPAQRPPVAAINQAPRLPTATPNLNIQTNPNYAPPAQGLGGLLESTLTKSIENDPAEARKAALEEYQRMVPQDQGLVDQRKKDAAALRAALEKQNAPLDWSDRLQAMAQGAMGGVRGGSNWMSEGVAGGAKLRGLEAAHAAKQAENLGVLKGMSEDDYNRDIALKEKLYGVGSKAYQEAVKAREEYLKTGAHLFSTQETARTASEQRKSIERIHELDRDAAERRVRLEAQLRASIPVAEIQLIERYMKDAGVSFAEAYKEIAGIKRPEKFDDKAYDKLYFQQQMTKDPVKKQLIQDQMDALMGIPVAKAGGTSKGSVSKSAIDAELAKRGG